VSGIGTGVTDFFVKPFQGAKDGSIVKAAGGFAEGSKSLLKNAFMAPVSSVSRIGGGLSRGLAALSFDQDYIEEKNKNNVDNKPANIGQGLYQGLGSAANGLWGGVSGVLY